MKDLTLTEEIFLLAVYKLKENAYGVTIRKHVHEQTGRLYPYGTLYSALDKLVRLGYLRKDISDPTPERGGRSKNYYFMKDEGAVALKTALELKNALWNDVEEISIGKNIIK